MPRETHYVCNFYQKSDCSFFSDARQGCQSSLAGGDDLTIRLQRHSKGQVGAADTWADGTQVPIFDRLYLGGPNNMRGFAFREVGPKDFLGNPIGGQSLARFTAEVTFPIIEKVRGAIFYDVGFVNAGSWQFTTANYNSDFGIGLLLELPAIGPIRIDYGIPIKADVFNDSSGQFQFNVGYRF